MANPANIREAEIGLGLVAQSAIHTANLQADFVRFNRLNPDLFNVDLNTESDAPLIGKGHEFAETTYNTNWDTSGRVEKWLSAEWAAFVMAFGLGHAVVAPADATAFAHTCTLLDTISQGIDLPVFSAVEQIRPGANDVLDRLIIGLAINSFTLRIGSGSGLGNAILSAEIVGTGKRTVPSGILLPATAAEHLLPAASVAFTINGTNLITAKNLVEMEWTVNNNIRLDTGYFPGSGYQDAADPTSGQLRGRMECGDRTITFRHVARFVDGSTELAQLESGTEGTSNFKVEGALAGSLTQKYDLDVTFHRIRYRTARLGNAAGLVTVQVDTELLKHASNGVLTAVVHSKQAKVGSEA